MQLIILHPASRCSQWLGSFREKRKKRKNDHTLTLAVRVGLAFTIVNVPHVCHYCHPCVCHCCPPHLSSPPALLSPMFVVIDCIHCHPLHLSSHVHHHSLHLPSCCLSPPPFAILVVHVHVVVWHPPFYHHQHLHLPLWAVACRQGGGALWCGTHGHPVSRSLQWWCRVGRGSSHGHHGSETGPFTPYKQQLAVVAWGSGVVGWVGNVDIKRT